MPAQAARGPLDLLDLAAGALLLAGRGVQPVSNDLLAALMVAGLAAYATFILVAYGGEDG